MSHAGCVRSISTHLFNLPCLHIQVFSQTKLTHKSIGASPFITLQIKIHLCRLISVFYQFSDWNPTLLISKECRLHTVFLWKAHFKMLEEISNNNQVNFSLPYYDLFTKKMQWQTGRQLALGYSAAWTATRVPQKQAKYATCCLMDLLYLRRMVGGRI